MTKKTERTDRLTMMEKMIEKKMIMKKMVIKKEKIMKKITVMMKNE